MARGAKYTLHNTTKARVKIGVVGSRAQLAYKELTKAAAAGEGAREGGGERRRKEKMKLFGKIFHFFFLI